MTWRKVVGLLVGFCGVVAVCMQSAFYGTESDSLSGEIGGYVMVTGAAASYGIASGFVGASLSSSVVVVLITGS